jgi:hypothetical protein
MSDPHTDHHAPTAVPFTDAELKEFQDSDKHAGGVIIALMTSIFTIGLLLYSTIAIIV